MFRSEENLTRTDGCCERESTWTIFRLAYKLDYYSASTAIEVSASPMTLHSVKFIRNTKEVDSVVLYPAE